MRAIFLESTTASLALAIYVFRGINPLRYSTTVHRSNRPPTAISLSHEPRLHKYDSDILMPAHGLSVSLSNPQH